ncbi:MAG: TIGR02281 family clan AA aspartic protease [Alphaproteobacteria bacterium]|nr:TIGR02281 family clan AA aspartic protease [Alphaproteobacteria bacterium]
MTGSRWLIFGLAAAALTALILWLAAENPSALDAEAGRANLLYYVMLLLLVGSGVLAGRRMGLRFAAKSVGVWILIGAALLLAYSYRFELEDLKDRLLGTVAPHAALMQDGAVTVRLGQDGHYHLRAEVNGEPIRFLVDTGASDIVLSPRDARRLGFDPAGLTYSKIYSTANGTVRGAPVTLDRLEVAGLRFRDVAASVNGADMRQSLLGMSFLDRFAGYEVRNGVLSLYP